MLFVGWDWASESHDVAVLDEDATTVDRWALGHGAEGIGDAHWSTIGVAVSTRVDLAPR